MSGATAANFHFSITPAGLTGSAHAVAPSAWEAGYAIETAEGYTITTLATVQMAATTCWSDGNTLDVTYRRPGTALPAHSARFGLDNWPLYGWKVRRYLPR